MRVCDAMSLAVSFTFSPPRFWPGKGQKTLRNLKIRRRFGGEGGSLYARFKKLNKDGLFSLKPHDTSDLAFSDSFVRFRPFASVCGFCQRNDTRNVTRREHLPSFFLSENAAADVCLAVNTES